MTKKKKTSWLKRIVKCVLGLVVIAVLALAGIYYYLGDIVKYGIGRFVPEMTQTTASVDKVDLSLLNGRVEVVGLKIGNPRGFSDQNIFELGRVLVLFEPRSILSDKILVKQVKITGTAVSAELKNLYSLDSNVSALQQNINAYLGGGKSSAKADKPAAQKSAAQSSGGKKVIIKDLTIADSRLSVGVGGKTAAIPLPDIHKTGIGEEKKGKTVGEAVAEILNMVSAESVKAMARAVADLAKQGVAGAEKLISTGLDSLSDSAKGTIGGIKGLLK